MTEQHAMEYVDALLIKIFNTPVGPDLKKFDKELIPIITELFTLQPGSHDHPSTKDLFNWLVNPERTGREFLYAITDLEDVVYGVMTKHFNDYVVLSYTDYGYSKGSYLGKIATEALAVICPIIEGHWEQIAWILIMVHIGSRYDKDIYSAASKQLCSWLIHIISDPDLCPNVNLRFWFMSLFFQMTDPSDFDRGQALDSILTTCSTLHIENRHIPIYIMTDIFNIIMAKDRFLIEFDDKLAGELLDLKSLRLSAVVQDVANHTAVRPLKYSQPMAFHALNVLLKYLSQRARLAIAKDFKQDSKQDIETESDEILPLFRVIRNHFKKSLETPQLADLLTFYKKDIEELYDKTKFDGFLGSNGGAW